MDTVRLRGRACGHWGRGEMRGRDSEGAGVGQAHAAMFKMGGQQGPTVAHGLPLNAMWQPGWEGRPWETGYLHMYD